ncbi:hypothetical protein DMUE_2971 [Dictyocoela muelleri]|nr:hypothetical protein DMUE_2971 [Dictyocoela muelleri]
MHKMPKNYGFTEKNRVSLVIGGTVKEPCRRTWSIYKNSYFELYQINNKKFLLYLYHFYNNIDKQKTILKELRITPNTYYCYKRKIESAIIRDYIPNKTIL